MNKLPKYVAIRDEDGDGQIKIWNIQDCVWTSDGPYGHDKDAAVARAKELNGG